MASRSSSYRSERKYQCKFCTKSFTRSSVLTDHIRVHTGEKPFQCKTCLRSFSQLANLTRHYKVHASVVRTFRCKYCDETFPHLASLLVHESTHAAEEDITPLAYPAVSFSNQTAVRSSLNADSIQTENSAHTNVNSISANTCFNNSNTILVSDESEDSSSFDQQINETYENSSCPRDKLELPTDVSADSAKYSDDKLKRENSSFKLSLKIPTEEVQVIEIKPDISPLSVTNDKLLSVNKTINIAESFNAQILQRSSSNQSDSADCPNSKNFDFYENTENLSGNIQYFKSENDLHFENNDLNVIPNSSAESRSLDDSSLPGTSSSFHFDHSHSFIDSFNSENDDIRRNSSDLGQLNICHSSIMKLNQGEELVIENQSKNDPRNEDYKVIPHEMPVNDQIENNDSLINKDFVSSDIILLNPPSSPKSTSQPANQLTYLIPQENQVILDSLNKSSISENSHNGNDEDVFITRCDLISRKSFQEENNYQIQSEFNRIEEFSVERVSEDVSIVIESVFSMKEDAAEKSLLSSADAKHLETSDEMKRRNDAEMINLVDFSSDKFKCDEQLNWSVPLVDIQEITTQKVDNAETTFNNEETGIEASILKEANLINTNILDTNTLKTEFQQQVLDLAPYSQEMTKNQSKGEKYTCKFCDKSFSQGRVLLKHITTHTEGKTPFLCDLCRQPFSQLTNLNEKRNGHFRNKMLHCQFCQRTFACSFQLLNHLKHHARSIERNIKILEDKIERRKTDGKVLVKRTEKIRKKSLDVGTSTNKKHVQQYVQLCKKNANQENDPNSSISDCQINTILAENDENVNPQYLGNRERKKNLLNEKGVNSVEVCENLTINSSSDSVVDNMSVGECFQPSNKTYKEENTTEIPILFNSSNEQNNIKINFESFTKQFTPENNLSSPNMLEDSRTTNKSLQNSLLQNQPIEQVSQIEYIENLPQHNPMPVSSFSASPQNVSLGDFQIKSEFPLIPENIDTIRTDCSSTTGINFQNDENKTEAIFETSKCVAGSSYNGSSSYEAPKSGEFRCKFCNKSFSRKFILIKHLRTHTGEKPYKCEFCPRLFSQLNNLNQHRKSHMSLRSFPCKMCSSRFQSISELNAHNKKLHVGMKPYVCKFCSKMFSRSSVLREHIRTHTGEKPYVCELCNRAFSQSTNLNRHMKVHVPGRVFRCRNCSYTFKQYWHFKRHMKTHNNSGRTSNDEASIRKSNKPYPRAVLQINSRWTKTSDDIIDKIPAGNENDTSKSNGLLEEKTENLESNNDSAFVAGIYKDTIQCDVLKTYSLQDYSNIQPFQETVSNIATRTPANFSVSGQLFPATNSSPLPHLAMRSVATPMQLVPNLCHKSFQQNSGHIPPAQGDKSAFNKVQSRQPFLLTSVPNQTQINKSFSLVKRNNNFILENQETVDESLKNEDARTLVNPVNSLNIVNVKLEPDDVIIENRSEVVPKVNHFDSVYRSQSAAPVKEFPCIFCNKLFHHSQVLCRHLRSHHKSEMMLSSTCQMCHVSFPDSDALVRHRKTCSQLMLPYFCNLCKEKFPNSSELNQHRQRKHSGGVKRYSCRYCTKVFARNSVLTEHIRTHTGERPFVCELCLRPFSQATNLKRHQKTHAKDGSFACQYCKETFNEFTLLSRHLRLHVEERKINKNYNVEQNRMKSKTRLFTIKASPIAQVAPREASETLSDSDVNKNNNVPFSNIKTQMGAIVSNYDIENIADEVVLATNKSRISEVGTMNDQCQTALRLPDVTRTTFRATEMEQIAPIVEESSLRYCFSEIDAGEKSRIIHKDDSSVRIARKMQNGTSNVPVSSSQAILLDTVFHDQSIRRNSSDMSNQPPLINTVKIEDNELDRNNIDAQSYDVGNVFKQQIIPSITPTANVRLHTFISSAERESDSFINKPYQTLDFEKKRQLNSHISTNSLRNAKICSTKTNVSHVCKFCKCSFQTSRQLLYHQQLKHPRKKSHQCKYCNRFFARTNVLTEHIRTHTGEKPFVCNTCGKAFSQLTNLKRHQKIHDRKVIACRYCKTVFTDYSLLLKHMRSHGKSQEKYPKCPTSNVHAPCNILTNVPDGIKHMSPQLDGVNTENKKDTSNCVSDIKSPFGSNLEHEQIFTPNSSSYSDSLDIGYSTTHVHSRYFSEVKKHRYTQHDRLSEISTWPWKTELTDNIELIPQSEVDESVERVTNDLISGKDGQPKKEAQHRISSNDSQLNKFSSFHISCSNSVNNAKKYSCQYCKDSFLQLAELHAHMAVCNDREKRHRCKYCNRVFGRSSILKQHVRIHTGERPFKCDRCSMCFTQSIHLKRHTKKHGVDDNQKKSNLRSFPHGLHKQFGYYRKSTLRKYNKKSIPEKSSESNTEIIFSPLSNPHSTDELSVNVSQTQCDSVQTISDKPVTVNSRSTSNDTELILSELNSLKQQSKINDSDINPSSSKNEKTNRADKVTVSLQPGISAITADSNFRPTAETINPSNRVPSFNESIDCNRYTSDEQRKYSSSAKKLHVCKICKEVYANRSQLSAHFKSHSKRLFQCTFCEKGFTRSSVLTEHIRTHTGEKPFNCIHCRRCFSQLTNLKRHLKVHNRQYETDSSDRRTS